MIDIETLKEGDEIELWVDSKTVKGEICSVIENGVQFSVRIGKKLICFTKENLEAVMEAAQGAGLEKAASAQSKSKKHKK